MSARARTAFRPLLECLEVRTLLNNRFVVPLDLPADNTTTFHDLGTALNTPGLEAGDFVQVEPGSEPGNIGDADLDAALADAGGGLTIRGNLTLPPGDLPVVGFTDAVTVDSPNLVLHNLNVALLGGNLTYLPGATGARILRSVINNHFSVPAADGVVVLQSTGAVIRGTSITSHAGAIASDVLQISPAAFSGHLISNNTFASPGAGTQNLLSYLGASVSTGDLVIGNQFFGDVGVASLLFVGNGVSDVTIRSNTFQDASNFQNAIDVTSSAQNIVIEDNTIRLTGETDTVGIAVQGGGAETTTSARILANRIDTSGVGTGVRFDPGAGGDFTARVEGNDLHFNQVGVAILAGGGGSVSGLDLGGGSQGSLGGNNFRGFTAAASSDAGAIVVAAGALAGPVSARFNLFGVADPEAVIFDADDSVALADVDASDNLTGNAAYVQALYLQFLRRAGDLGNPGDAGGWVSQLNGGAPPGDVANAIVRSAEALGVLTDGLYRQFLAREADPLGRASFVAFFQDGGTLESAVSIIVSSPEYRTLFASDAAYVQSLYNKLLGRTGSDAEVEAWIRALRVIGRRGVALGFLVSPEYRTRVVRGYYAELLNRLDPSDEEVSGWVNTRLDVLTIAVQFAGSEEFQVKG